MNYIITGKVIRGDGYGKVLGFPTVNLEHKINDFPAGVYTGKGILNKKTYRAAIVINKAGRIEAYLFGYKGNAYDKEVTFEIKKFLRKFKKFKTEKELITQIKKDIKICSQA